MCCLKLWKMNYNARNKQYKSLITLLARAYKFSHVLCQLSPGMLLNDLFKNYQYIYIFHVVSSSRDFPIIIWRRFMISLYVLHNLSFY
jgi:hypothetical protein